MSTSDPVDPAGAALLALGRDLAGRQLGRPEFRGELRDRLVYLAERTARETCPGRCADRAGSLDRDRSVAHHGRETVPAD